MKASLSITLLAASSFASAAALQARDASAVLDDISTIRSQLAVVQSDIDAFQGGPTSAIDALKIQVDSNTLDSSIDKSTSDANSSSPFTEKQSADVANAVTGLQEGIFTVLDSLVAKKTGFETAVLGGSAVPLVRMTLSDLRTDTAAFGDAVTDKLTPELAKLAPLITSNIDFHFARAVDAFSD